MIDFRYHVVSIVAIFLALAVGIVLGAGPLGEQVSEGLVDQADRDRVLSEELRDQVQDLESVASYDDEFAVAVTSAVLEGRLAGRQVTVLTMPDADDDIVEELRADVERAGATVTGQIAATPALLDPANRQVAQNLASQVLEGVEGLGSLEDATSYEVVGYALARGYLTTDPGADAVDPKASEIQSALSGGDFVTAGEPVETRGDLLLVVGGAAPESPEAGVDELIASLLGAADAQSQGVVVAGPTSSASEGGAVRAIRDNDASDDVSTVDTAARASGRVVAVLALAEQAADQTAQYGLGDGADATVPDVPELETEVDPGPGEGEQPGGGDQPSAPAQPGGDGGR